MCIRTCPSGGHSACALVIFGALMSSSENPSPTPFSLPGDASRLFQVARPHLGNMLRRAAIDTQDHEDLLQETYLGFLTFLQRPETKLDCSRSLLPVLIDIMQKRICDYRSRNRWKYHSAGGRGTHRCVLSLANQLFAPGDIRHCAKGSWRP